MMLRRPDQPLHIGWREWIALPGLGVPAIKAKVDTGARTSALHAWNVEPFHKSGSLWLRFDLHPKQRSQTSAVRCEAEVADERSVRNSGGIAEKRHVIVTMLRLGDDAWDIEISLTNRDEMGFRLLLGRTALCDRALVEPGASYLWGRPKLNRRLPPHLASEARL